jgi:hypothetical protein
MAITFSVSPKGLEAVDLKRREKGWRKDEPDWSAAADISVATLKRFWRGLPIQQESFVSICQAVGLEDWKDLIDRSEYGGGSDITRYVESIIKKRHSIAEAVYQVCHHLETLLREINALNDHRYTLENTIEGMSTNRLHELNLQEIEACLHQEIEMLQKLVARLSRSTLNVGVIGRMRQGKSSFLQSVSGLSDDVIPTRSGGACTATMSKIYHHEGDIKAVVKLHSAKSFLEEVIRPYFRQLDLAYLPKNLEDFANYSLSVSAKSALDSASQAVYEHLKEYQLNLQQYREFLEEEPQNRIISVDEIPAYEIQQRDEQGHLTSFKHFAVRDVEIFCHFPRAEATKLGLVDTPGLGDTRLGDTEIILRTLAHEVDIVIIIRRPNLLGDQWQVEDLMLYDLASKELPDFERRAFILLNHQQINGDNIHTSEFMKATVDKMKVVDCLIADCCDAEEASQVLNEVVQYLNQNILNIEENYVQSCQNRLIEVYKFVKKELDKAQIALSLQTDERRLFRTLFPRLMQRLTSSLFKLAEDLKNNQKDKDFLMVLKGILADCQEDPGIPSLEEIRDRFYDPMLKGSYITLYYIYLTELRIHLAKKFSGIADALDQVANRLKLQIGEILIKQANLGNLFDAGEINFLDEFVNMLALRENPLELGFRKLLTFNISYESIFLPQIRQILMSELDSNATEQFASITPSSKGDDLTPEVLYGKLQEIHQRVMEQCQKVLDKSLEVPSRVSYFMAMEFLDYVLNDKDAVTEWEIFLGATDIRSKIWTDFQEVENQKEVQLNWLNSVERIQNLNQRQAIEFLS